MSEQQLTPRQIWLSEINTFRSRIFAAKIPPDLNPAMVRVVRSQLAGLYEEIRPIYGRVKLRVGEVDRLKERIETKGRVGASEAARRINGVLAVEQFRQSDGTLVNIYDLEAEAKAQKEEVEVLLDIIEEKRQAIITFNALFKVEAGLG